MMLAGQGALLTPCITLGTVQIRPAERSLWVDGQLVAIGARAFDVLLALAERRERVVSKNELLDLAWPGLVVEENNLSVQISALRKLLGAAAIATVTGRGYRLALAVPALLPAPPADLAQRIVRRLATIVHADVAGWARLVHRDAMAAVQAWQRTRTELIEATVPAAGGRLIELTPERMLLEFGSVVQALVWALHLQQALAERRRADPSGALRLRIGLAVDDVIVDDGKLVGDGVSMAAGVHQMASHDEVLITGLAHALAVPAQVVQFEPLAEHLLRPGMRPVPLWRVSALPSGAANDAVTAPSPQPWDQLPSIAVLPLLAEGVADSYFGDGVTEEIIATLALNRALFVIAHNSTLRYRRQLPGSAPPDPLTVAAELAVRYVLTGTVRRAGQQLRINVSLVHASVGRVIWQQRYDGQDDDVFGFQRSIAGSVAAAIDPQVQEAEVQRLRGRPTDSFSAYDCVLRGQAVLYNFGAEDYAAARRMFERAIELDPDYAQAHALLAWWFNLRVGEGRSSEVGEDGRLAQAHAQRAVQLDPQDAVVLSVAGHIDSFLGRRFDSALQLFDQALARNPSCAVAWARSATTLAYLGRGQEALDRVRQAMRLSPFDQQSFAFFTTCGTASLVVGRPAEAVAWLGKALRLNPRYNAALRMQVAALVLAGELSEARELAQALLATDPEFSVAAFGAWYPLQPPHLHDLLEALRRAGLPG